MPLFCLLLSIWVVVARPRDVSAWLLFLTLQFFSTYFSVGIESWGPVVRDVAEIYRIGLTTAWPIFMLLFGLYFSRAFSRRGSGFLEMGEAPTRPRPAGFLSRRCPSNLSELENFASVAWLAAALERFSKVSFVLSFAATSCFFAAISAKSGAAVTPDTKRRLNLLEWGTTISMAPACILYVTQAIKGRAMEKILLKW